MNNYSDLFTQGFNNYNQFMDDSSSQHNQQPNLLNQHEAHHTPFLIAQEKQTNTIKERLNLHVKRKILENSTGNSTITSQQYQQQQQLKTVSQKNSSAQTPLKRTRKNKKNGTPTSRSSSTTCPGNGEDSRDGSLSCPETNSTGNSIIATGPKEKGDNTKKPDILAQILNQKKMALMRDPEIVALLTSMTQKIINKKNITEQDQQHH